MPFFRSGETYPDFHPGCLGIVPCEAYPQLHFFQPEMLFTATRRIHIFQRSKLTVKTSLFIKKPSHPHDLTRKQKSPEFEPQNASI
jgi:hypothetical protein